MNNSTLRVSIDLERLLQLIELSDRLVKMGYASRTEANFVNTISHEVIEKLENQKSTQEINNIDEND